MVSGSHSMVRASASWDLPGPDGQLFRLVFPCEAGTVNTNLTQVCGVALESYTSQVTFPVARDHEELMCFLSFFPGCTICLFRTKQLFDTQEFRPESFPYWTEVRLLVLMWVLKCQVPARGRAVPASGVLVLWLESQPTSPL